MSKPDLQKRVFLGRKQILTRSHYAVIAIFAITATLYASLLPFNFQYKSMPDAVNALKNMTYFHLGESEARGDWLITAVTFWADFFLLSGAFSVDRPNRVVSSLFLVPTCCLLSTMVEFLQVYFPPRTVSVNDLAIQTLGGWFGILTWCCWGQTWTTQIRDFHHTAFFHQFIGKVTFAAFLLVGLVAVMPFDFVITTDELRRKFQENRIRLHPFILDHFGLKQFIEMLTATFAMYGVLGILTGITEKETSRIGPEGMISYIFGIYFVRMFVFSRDFDAFQAGLACAAALVGRHIAITQWHRFRSLKAPYTVENVTIVSRGLLFIWVGVVFCALVFLPRETFSDEGPRVFYFPLVEFYYSQKSEVLVSLARRMALFVPFGLFFPAVSNLLPERFRRILLVTSVATLALFAEFTRLLIFNASVAVSSLAVALVAVAIAYEASSYFGNRFIQDWVFTDRH